MITYRILAAVALAGLTACGSVQKRTFRILTVDTKEKPLSCLVVIGDDWQGATERQRVVANAPLPVELVFDHPTVEVTVMHVMVDGSGKIENPPTSRSSDSEYLSEVREIGQNDPPDQLFILERRR